MEYQSCATFSPQTSSALDQTSSSWWSIVYGIPALFGDLWHRRGDKNAPAKLSLDNFDVCAGNVPDDINLSNNVCSDLQLEEHSLSLESINNVSQKYAKLCRNLRSDFTVDIFVDKFDEAHKFSVAKLLDVSNTKNAIYLPGNNDYFYNKDFALKLKNNGYNFYALSIPSTGFASNVSDYNY